ncbi:MAG: hypothetical protein IPM51_15350 [Sphingobacteriaceae bacterium]|nr:hypothetical protein [Sphingobacteriaceae bacterium]
MKDDIKKVIKFIEENIRVTDQTSIEYIDPKGHVERLNTKQNQVIFGRRGSGKSLLLKSLAQKSSSTICLKINLEDFKDISFPDSIIQVLKLTIQQLKDGINADISIFDFRKWLKSKKVQRKLNKTITDLEKRLKDPDTFDESTRKKTGSKVTAEAKSGIGKTGSKIGAEESEELESSRTIKVDKLNILKNELTNFKDLIQTAANLIDKDIYLILDDFYFIRKADQPYLVDFFHRLTKNTRLYLKVATIKHRSSLYIQGETYVGVEIGHDAQALNLDYSLEDFNALVNFMKDLLSAVNKKVGVNIDYESLLTPNAFRFLCLASGGVPRDFFSLFILLSNKMVNGERSITKPNVIEVCIENLPNKLEAFKTDSAEEKEILEHYLSFIKEEIIAKKKWNSFLVSKNDVLNYSGINQAIKELVDLRLLHIANSNTSSAPSDGGRYTAYVVDIGLFPNSNPRGFQQIEPGQKDDEGREDKLRSSPKLNLENYKSYIQGLNLKLDLKVTE